MDTKDTKNHKGTRRLSVCFYHKALKGALTRPGEQKTENSEQNARQARDK